MERLVKKVSASAALLSVSLAFAPVTPAAAQAQYPAAQGQAQDGAAETVGDGLYVRVGAGASFLGDWEQDITRSPDLATCMAIGCNPNASITEFDTGFTAAGAIGFNYTEGIRTELEYRYDTTGVSRVRLFEGGVEVGPELGDVPAVVNDDVNAHFIFTNFYFDLNNRSSFTPFIGGGVGGAFVENASGARDSALAYQGRAGVAYDFGGGLSFDVEYIYLRTNDLSFGPNDDEFTLEAPLVRVDGDHYQSSSAMASIRKQF